MQIDGYNLQLKKYGMLVSVINLVLSNNDERDVFFINIYLLAVNIAKINN